MSGERPVRLGYRPNTRSKGDEPTSGISRKSFADVFTNVKHSNTHHLCSLWMWFVGQNASSLVYRLPSVLASIGTIVLAGLIGLRQSRLEGCIAVILTSWSYLLIHFGTEARGYSLAIFFALLAWYALQQFEERRSWIWIIVFWSAVVLGFLAHLEFAICFAALVAWALRRFVRYRSKWRQAVLDLFALFTVPIVLIAILLPVPLSVRYFMISVATSLLLLAAGWAALLRRGVAGHGMGLTLLAVFAVGNAVNTGNLLRFGRGEYLAALRFIEKNSDGREVVITSDHDFRNAMLVNYYKRHLARPDSIRYANGPTLNEGGADWVILHRFELTGRPDRVADGYGNAYQLVKIYRYSDNSGWNWLLYHNLNRPPVVPQSALSR